MRQAAQNFETVVSPGNWIDEGSGCLGLLLDHALPFSGQSASLLNFLITQRMGGYSIWWSGQQGQSQSQMIVCSGMPSDRAYLTLLAWGETPVENEEAPSYIDKIIAVSLHAREIVRKLMIFARQAPAERSSVDLNQVVRDGLFFIESRCAKGGVEVIHTLAPDLPRIDADRGQLHQVLVNLAVNAAQAMSEGGRLAIRTSVLADQVALVVEDSGPGMSPEVRKHIFDPFFTTKDVGEGTGLGLPVVHGIVKAHGVDVEVSSKPGKGTRFRILFPVAADRDPGTEHES